MCRACAQESLFQNQHTNGEDTEIGIEKNKDLAHRKENFNTDTGVENNAKVNTKKKVEMPFSGQFKIS